jgi:hypothetical protein
MHNFLISSAQRKEGTSENFVIDFVTPLEGKYLVRYILIPNTLYNVNSKNNVIPYYDTQDRVALIEPGSYTGTTLAAAIKQIMDTVSAPLTYNVNYDSVSAKLRIEVSAGTFYFRFGTIQDNIANNIMGFLNENSNPLAVQVGVYPINLSYPASLVLFIKEAASFNIETSKNDFFHIYIPFDVAFGYYKTLSSDILRQIIYFSTRRKRISLQVLDVDGNPVFLNNGNFEILLQKL